MQGYRRTRECVPARPKLAVLVRLRLSFYDRFLHAFGAVPHAGASFAGALPARGTAQTRDGGIVLNPSDWRESGTPRFSSGGPCAACTPPRLFWHRRKRRRLRSQEDDLRRGPRRGDSISARAFRACYMSAACVYTLAQYARARLSLGPLSVFLVCARAPPPSCGSSALRSKKRGHSRHHACISLALRYSHHIRSEAATLTRSSPIFCARVYFIIPVAYATRKLFC